MFDDEANFKQSLTSLVEEYEGFFDERDNPEISEVENLMIMYRNKYGIYNPRHGQDFYLSVKGELDRRKNIAESQKA